MKFMLKERKDPGFTRQCLASVRKSIAENRARGEYANTQYVAALERLAEFYAAGKGPR